MDLYNESILKDGQTFECEDYENIYLYGNFISNDGTQRIEENNEENNEIEYEEDS